MGLLVENSEETHHLLSQAQLDEKVVIVDLDKSTVQSAWGGEDMCPSVLDMLPKRHLDDLRMAIDHKVAPMCPARPGGRPIDSFDSAFELPESPDMDMNDLSPR